MELNAETIKSYPSDPLARQEDCEIILLKRKVAEQAKEIEELQKRLGDLVEQVNFHFMEYTIKDRKRLSALEERHPELISGTAELAKEISGFVKGQPPNQKIYLSTLRRKYQVDSKQLSRAIKKVLAEDDTIIIDTDRRGDSRKKFLVRVRSAGFY